MIILLRTKYDREVKVMEKEKKGFTLLEVIVATALFGVCILFIAQLLTNGLRAYKKFRAEAIAKQTADSVLDQISSEVRSAYHIDSFNPTSIVFYRYFSDGYVYKVQYLYVPSTKTVERLWWLVGSEGSVNGSDIIGSNVENFNLTYSNDLKYTGLKARVSAQVITEKNETGKNVKPYQTATESKRRVVKQADNVSITTE